MKSHVAADRPAARPAQVERLGDLLDRLGLPGEGGLLDAEAGRLDEPGIGGYDVAGFEQHDVARHQFGGGYLGHLAGPPHPDYGRSELAQGAHGLLGLYSWRKPRAPLRTTMAMMTMASS